MQSLEKYNDSNKDSNKDWMCRHSCTICSMNVTLGLGSWNAGFKWVSLTKAQADARAWHAVSLALPGTDILRCEVEQCQAKNLRRSSHRYTVGWLSSKDNVLASSSNRYSRKFKYNIQHASETHSRNDYNDADRSCVMRVLLCLFHRHRTIRASESFWGNGRGLRNANPNKNPNIVIDLEDFQPQEN